MTPEFQEYAEKQIAKAMSPGANIAEDLIGKYTEEQLEEAVDYIVTAKDRKKNYRKLPNIIGFGGKWDTSPFEEHIAITLLDGSVVHFADFLGRFMPIKKEVFDERREVARSGG